MSSQIFNQRHMEQNLPSADTNTVVLLTGARQTGKTTLLKHHYPDVNYINLDAIEDREKLNAIPTAAWTKVVGPSVIDEAQKLPQVFEKVKYAFDSGELNFSVLSGSSQVLLLKHIRETLAGRIKLLQLYPLTLSEIEATYNHALSSPLLDHILNSKNVDEILQNIPSVLLGQKDSDKFLAQEYLHRWGGMPKLLQIPEQDRDKWLRDYEYTYLERDLSDLARLNDLQPFRTLQKLAALRSAQLLNYSELARDSSISVDTAKRFLEYLKISYQVFLLPPYYENLTSTLVKTPKIYWLDMGIWRVLTGQITGTTGQSIETLVISEILKWIKMFRPEIEAYFYRTHSGFEVDLLLQRGQEILGCEIKSSKKIVPKDFRALRQLGETLQDRWLGGLLVYNGDELKKLADPHIWAIPIRMLLGQL